MNDAQFRIHDREFGDFEFIMDDDNLTVNKVIYEKNRAPELWALARKYYAALQDLT